MLRKFGRALSEAIEDSPEASRLLEGLRDEGYWLYLMVKEREEDDPFDLDPSALDSEPAFQPSDRDRRFLKAIGISTRRRPRRDLST